MLNHSLWGNSIETWLIALGVSAGLLLIAMLARNLLARRFFKLDQRREDDVNALIAALLKSVSMPIVAVLFVYVGALSLKIADRLDLWAFALAMIAVIAQITRWGKVLISSAHRITTATWTFSRPSTWRYTADSNH